MQGPGWGHSRRFDRRPITSVLSQIADIFRAGRNVSKVQILLKSRKSRGSEDLANVECWRSRPLHGSAESMGASVVAFGLIDEVPHIAARKTYE